MIFAENSFDYFVSTINKKRLIAFGASSYLQNICKPYPELNLANNIECIVDNDPKKWNGIYTLDGKEIPIYAPTFFEKEPNNSFTIIISSCEYSYDIWKQLDLIPNLKDVECFVLPLLISEHSDNDSFEFKSESSEIIPKIIHCFWFSKSEKDKLSKMCLESWKKTNPDFEIKEWNSENYDIEKNNYMKKAYENRKWAFVTDYARMDVINQYGGFYFDLDVELYKSLNEIRNHKMVIGFGVDRGIEGAAFGAQKKCNIVCEMLDIYENLEFDLERIEKGEIQPFFLSKIFINNGFLLNGKLQEKDGICLLPKEYFSNKDFLSGIIKRDICSIGVHHYASGWKDEKTREHENRQMKQINLIKKEYYNTNSKREKK